MIKDPFTYLALLLFIAGALKFAEAHAPGKFLRKLFDYVPAVVMLYVITMILGSTGLWESGEKVIMSVTTDPETGMAIEQATTVKTTISAVSGVTRSHLMPAMIFLLMLHADIRQIFKIGPRMIGVFVLGMVGIMVGFIVAVGIFIQFSDKISSDAMAALCGSWIGGTTNMISIQGALNIPGESIGYVMAVDTIYYSLVLVVMLFLVPFAKVFNRWTKADTSKLNAIIAHLENSAGAKRRAVNFADLIFLVGAAAMITVGCFAAAEYTVKFFAGTALGGDPKFVFLTSASLWQVLYATIIGLLGAMTILGRLPGSVELGNTLLFFVIAITGAEVNIAALEWTAATAYLGISGVVLVIHFIVMIVGAKIFKFDAYSCQCSSLANIGGVASATIISGAYSGALIPIGVLMATLGSICGTGGGLIVGILLARINGI